MFKKYSSAKQKQYKNIFFILVFNLMSFVFYGQMITGTVVDDLNQSILGATVMLKGTTIGTVTDLDGKFTLDISKSQSNTIVVSFMGFLTKEVPISNQMFLVITLSEDVNALDEVVVIGYGTQKRKDITGSIASISSKDFQ